jgi:phage tail sheath protein FI
MFGFKPKVMIAPLYSQMSLVADELQAKAVKYKAMALLDTPVATSYTAMTTSRGIGGLFQRSNSRTIGCYPWVKVKNLNTGLSEVRPRSQYLAGIISNNDADPNKGYWTSPSNTVINGIEDEELALTFDIQDANTEVNYLNSIGIVTGANAYGIGILNWGNRNLAYPSNTSVESFINVRRTFDIVEESIGLAMIQFIDVANVTQGSIDRVKDTVNDFIDVLIGREALLPGTKLTYNPNLNPPNQLATGQVVFTLSGMSAIPIERMTFEVNFDVSLLNFAA